MVRKPVGCFSLKTFGANDFSFILVVIYLVMTCHTVHPQILYFNR